jgi:hypothetical protein
MCAWINKDVRSLDVAVHHAHAVQVGQAARRLVEDLKQSIYAWMFGGAGDVKVEDWMPWPTRSVVCRCLCVHACM